MSETIDLPARQNDVYDHHRVELLISEIAYAANKLDCNELEIEAATRSLNAVVVANLIAELGEALPACVTSKRKAKKSAAKTKQFRKEK